jgi:hypothetical protein
VSSSKKESSAAIEPAYGVEGSELSECDDSPLKSPGGLDNGTASSDFRFDLRNVFRVRPTDPDFDIASGSRLSCDERPSGISTSKDIFLSVKDELNSRAPGIVKREGSDRSRNEVGRAAEERRSRRRGVERGLGGVE